MFQVNGSSGLAPQTVPASNAGDRSAQSRAVRHERTRSRSRSQSCVENAALLGLMLSLCVGASGAWGQAVVDMVHADAAVRSAPSPALLAHRAQPVATYLDGEVTVGELEDAIAGTSPLIQSTALASENLYALLERLVRFELLAAEAERRGYATHNAVRNALTQDAVARMLARDVEGKQTPEMIAEDAVERYQREHAEELTQPEQRRAAQLVLTHEADARALLPRVGGSDSAAFRALVKQHSVDEVSKQRSGDLGFFDVTGKGSVVGLGLDPASVRAAFALRAPGDTSDVIRTSSGFAVVRLEEVRPAREVPEQHQQWTIRKLLNEQKRQGLLDAIVAKQRAAVQPRVRRELLDVLHFDPETSQ